MTSRRSIQTYGARVSRALQFVPGHVGGRVASAQPVTLRERVGVAGVPFVGCADTNWVAANGCGAPFEYIYDLSGGPSIEELTTGTAGQATLGDGLDTTYVTLSHGDASPWASVYPDAWGPLGAGVTADFPAFPNLATCSLAYLDIKIRYNNLDMTDNTAVGLDVSAGDMANPVSNYNNFYLYDSVTTWTEHTYELRVDRGWIGATRYDLLHASLVNGNYLVKLYLDDLSGWTDVAEIDISQVWTRVRVVTP